MLKIFNKILCFFGIHKSDKDYGMKGLGGDVFSECVHCEKTIYHKNLKWVGGGNI